MDRERLIKEILYKAADTNKITYFSDESYLEDLNLDSLETFELIYSLEEVLEVEINLSILDQKHSVSSFCHALLQIQKNTNSIS